MIDLSEILEEVVKADVDRRKNTDGGMGWDDLDPGARVLVKQAYLQVVNDVAARVEASVRASIAAALRIMAEQNEADLDQAADKVEHA